MRLFVSAVSLVSTTQAAACSANCDAATLTSYITNNGPSDFTVVCDEDRTQEGFQEHGLTKVLKFKTWTITCEKTQHFILWSYIHRPIDSRVMPKTITTSCARARFCRLLASRRKRLLPNANSHVRSLVAKIALVVIRMSLFQTWSTKIVNQEKVFYVL